MADVEQRIQQEVDRRVTAEVDRRVAIEVAQKVRRILEQWQLARHRMFGPSSEAHLGQGRLFNEAELAAVATDEAAVGVTAAPSHVAPAAPRRGKRQPLPPELPRVDVVVEVPEAERQCACGTSMVKIGEQISERLDIIPMQIRVIRTLRPRYACPQGDHAPVMAPVPAQVLPHSQFSAGFLATLLTVKYADGVPLNRFTHVLARHGATVPRQSLARAVIGAAQALQPVHNLLRDALLESPVLHMDETPVQVLKEPDKPPSSKSYMWVQRGGPPSRPVILFDYDPSRSGQVPLRLLEGWQGYLMTDGYEGYTALARTPGVEHLACAAHARRKFVEAQRVQAKGKRGRADDALDYFARLYRIEREAKGVSAAERSAARQQHSRPILGELHQWLQATLPQVPPKSKLGEALAYLAKVWSKLVRYTERGDLPIDNNLCENAIRPFVIGRKGWLFADTPAGAHASAVIYSLIETAKANHREPFAWLRYVLERLPLAQAAESFEALLPWNVHDQDLAMNLAA